MTEQQQFKVMHVKITLRRINGKEGYADSAYDYTVNTSSEISRGFVLIVYYSVGYLQLRTGIRTLTGE